MTIKIHRRDLEDVKDPIFAYCRKLVEEGVEPTESLEVYGPSMEDPTTDILHMKVNIGNGANCYVKDNNQGTPVIRRKKRDSSLLH